MAGRGPVILDTCALLYLPSGDPRLSREGRRRVAAAQPAYVCAVSGFEIGVKHRSGKLALPSAPDSWVREVVDHYGLTVLELSLSDAIAATRLPPIHKDPCDRFIIAAAKSLGCEVVTNDTRFERYGVATFC